MHWPDQPRVEELWPRHLRPRPPRQAQTAFIPPYPGQEEESLGERALIWVLSAVFVVLAVFPLAFILVMVILIALAPYLG